MIQSFEVCQPGRDRVRVSRSLLRQAAMVLVTGLACSVPVAAQSGAPADVLEYYWPDHQKSLTFKAKSHAFRGSLQFDSGAEVKIGAHTYRELKVSATRLVPKESVSYLRAGDQGLYHRYDKSEKSPEILELKLPASVGDEWQTVNREGQPSNRKITKIASCQVRGRDFAKCITINFIGAEDMPGVAVFTPGYGEVVNSQVNGFIYRELNLKSP